jgi:hypothetical protein
MGLRLRFRFWLLGGRFGCWWDIGGDGLLTVMMRVLKAPPPPRQAQIKASSKACTRRTHLGVQAAQQGAGHLALAVAAVQGQRDQALDKVVRHRPGRAQLLERVGDVLFILLGLAVVDLVRVV